MSMNRLYDDRFLSTASPESVISDNDLIWPCRSDAEVGTLSSPMIVETRSPSWMRRSRPDIVASVGEGLRRSLSWRWRSSGEIVVGDGEVTDDRRSTRWSSGKIVVENDGLVVEDEEVSDDRRPHDNGCRARSSSSTRRRSHRNLIAAPTMVRSTTIIVVKTTISPTRLSTSWSMVGRIDRRSIRPVRSLHTRRIYQEVDIVVVLFDDDIERRIDRQHDDRFIGWSRRVIVDFVEKSPNLDSDCFAMLDFVESRISGIWN